MFKHVSKLSGALVLLASIAPCQEILPAEAGKSVPIHNILSPDGESKRILGIIPNYRTAPSLSDSRPLAVSEKFRLASEDALDRGTMALASIFAGEGQLTNSNRSLGQGAAAYGRYLGAAYADFAIGDYMTEGLFPSLLHQDPRYFRRGSGGGWSRLRYAVGQTFLTHGDSGKTQINWSELIGNSSAVAISNAYYADNRTASNAASKLGMQLAVDTAANALKEFWPDLLRKFSRHQSYPEDSFHDSRR